MRVQTKRGGIILGSAIVAAVFICGNVWAAASDLLAPTNVARNDNLVASITLNPKLTAAAESRLANMQANHYFGHVQPDGTSFGEAATAAGYPWVAVAENLACGFTTPQAVVDAWMNSPGHRTNMLNAAYREVGFAQGAGDCGLISVAIYASTVHGNTAALVAPAPAARVAIPTPTPAPATKAVTPAPAPTPNPVPPASPIPVATTAPTSTPSSTASVSPAVAATIDAPTPRPLRALADPRASGALPMARWLVISGMFIGELIATLFILLKTL